MPSDSDYLGFGFSPQESTHHFRVMIPVGSAREVFISEHFSHDPQNPGFYTTTDEHDGQLKVKLTRNRWNAIAEEARVELNRRLKAEGIKAIRNWLGLQQEERWWLYSMTNAATGHATSGKGRGWRKAVRYALTENPVPDESFNTRRAYLEEIDAAHALNLGLFSQEETDTANDRGGTEQNGANRL